MKSEWKVTCNGAYYEVYRQIDVTRVDHSGNREYAKPTFKTKDLAQAYADGANTMEAVKAIDQVGMYANGMSWEEAAARAAKAKAHAEDIEDLNGKTAQDKDLEEYHKAEALEYFEKALEAGGKHFILMLSDDGETVDVIDEENGARRTVNIACDNVPAMMLDILKQAGDWIL